MNRLASISLLLIAALILSACAVGDGQDSGQMTPDVGKPTVEEPAAAQEGAADADEMTTTAEIAETAPVTGAEEVTATQGMTESEPSGEAKSVEAEPAPQGGWAANVDTQAGSLDLVNPDGRTFAVFPPGSTIGAVEWSPDGSLLLVSQRHWRWQDPDTLDTDGQPLQLWEVRLDENTVLEPQLLFQSSTVPSLPETMPEQLRFGTWSPDGRRIFYWVGPTGPSFEAAGLALWASNLETGVTARLAEKALLNPHYQSWAPDSSALVYTAGGRRSAQVNKWLNIYTVSTNQVTTTITMTEHVPGMVAWSPRGDQIAYATVPAAQTGPDLADWMTFENPAIAGRRIYLLNPQTQAYRRLNATDAFQDAPVWSESGNTLYFVQRIDESVALMEADPSTGEASAIDGSMSSVSEVTGFYGQYDWATLWSYRPN